MSRNLSPGRSAAEILLIDLWIPKKILILKTRHNSKAVKPVFKERKEGMFMWILGGSFPIFTVFTLFGLSSYGLQSLGMCCFSAVITVLKCPWAIIYLRSSCRKYVIIFVFFLLSINFIQLESVFKYDSPTIFN